MNSLTKRDAFKAMVLFLEYFLNKNNYDELRPLLGDLSFLPDESTADPAAWEDWIEIVNKIIDHRTTLTSQEAFKAVKLFLEKYYQETSCADTAAVLGNMQLSPDGIVVNKNIWDVWLQCIDDVKAGKGDFYLHLFKP